MRRVVPTMLLTLAACSPAQGPRARPPTEPSRPSTPAATRPAPTRDAPNPSPAPAPPAAPTFPASSGPVAVESLSADAITIVTLGLGSEPYLRAYALAGAIDADPGAALSITTADGRIVAFAPAPSERLDHRRVASFWPPASVESQPDGRWRCRVSVPLRLVRSLEPGEYAVTLRPGSWGRGLEGVRLSVPR